MSAEMLNLALLFDDPDFFLLAGLTFQDEEAQRQTTNTRFDFKKVSDEMSWKMFRFRKDDILTLRQKLRLPVSIKLENGSVVSGLDALCMFLRRLAYPSRLLDLASLFGRKPSDISRAVKFVLDHIYEHFCGLLENLNRPLLSSQHLQEMAQSVQNKGCPFDRCWGFIDGTIMQICRPKEHQRQVYSGHKKVHCLKFQSVMLPNGIIGSFMGPYIGRRHDAGIFHESKLLDQLLLSQFVMTPFKGANVTQEQHSFNKTMSSHRICVK